MKKAKLSTREIVMLVLLVVLLIGVVYYMGFYTPLQEELASIDKQKTEVEEQILVSQAKVAQMNAMQKELDEILSRPESEITEIAPYDNKEVVLNQLHLILGNADEYSLSFIDPEVAEDDTVRRVINMEFKCSSYTYAKQIVRSLTESPWRCLVSNLSIESDYGNMQSDSVTVIATITYFEHKGLS